MEGSWRRGEPASEEVIASPVRRYSSTTHSVAPSPGPHPPSPGVHAVPADDNAPALAIDRLNLLYDPPVEGSELKPYVLLRTNLGAKKSVDDEKTVNFKWLTGPRRLCAAPQCRVTAKLQCLGCVKGGVPVERSFFCSQECLVGSWRAHKLLHRPVDASSAAWSDDNDFVSAEAHAPESSDASVRCRLPPPIHNTWTPVATTRAYTPTADDVGCQLRLEACPQLDDMPDHATWHNIETSGVLGAPPLPPPRQMVHPKLMSSTHGIPFRVCCYNVLADMYATRALYPYCPLWALSWSYRKVNLMREIARHDADIVCLQEVQKDAFQEFFRVQMNALGYDGVYKKKNRNLPDDQVDGCAIFFKRERFALGEKYGIDFNTAAYAQFQHNRRALKRLIRGNVALVVVLEDLLASQRARQHNRKARPKKICIANTHTYWDPEFADVKLWQAFVLCQELEKLVMRRDIPLVLCGDLNSRVESPVYELITTRRVHPQHDVFQRDPAHILPPPGQIVSHLNLASSYAATGSEPQFTNYTGHFVGVLDYVFYSQTSLVPVGVLEIDDESTLQTHTALPNPQHSSDHCPLIIELDYPTAAPTH